MKSNIVPKIYATDLRAFIEKAFRSMDGKKLGNITNYIDYIVYYLERFLQGDIRKLLVNLPGRHLKTFVCSVCLPAFMLGIDPTLKFLIVAHIEDLAEEIVRQIREIMESPWYQKAFSTRLDPRHSRKYDFKIVGGGRVRAAPVRSVTGKGGGNIIFDDPHNALDWDNEAKKSKVIEAFEHLVSRRDGGIQSRMLVVGHRVAENDLSAHILERGDFMHVCLPLFASKDMRFSFGDRTLHLSKGEALRPDAFPPSEIESIRLHHQGSPFWLYFLQGLGSKQDDFLIEVKHFRFVRWDKEDHFLNGGHVVLSVDPTQKTESASRNVIHVYAVQGKRYILLQAFAEKCPFSRLAKKVKHFAQFYNASLAIIENTARGSDLIEELRREGIIKVIAVNPRGTKSSRLRQCIPVIREKRICVQRNRPEAEAAIDEVLAYPNGAYNDHVDALTNFVVAAGDFTADTFVNAPRPQCSTPAMATSHTAASVRPSVQGIAVRRPPSMFGPQPLPDFSNGRVEPDRRPDGSSHYAAKDSSEPIYAFNGEKMVRIR